MDPCLNFSLRPLHPLLSWQKKKYDRVKTMDDDEDDEKDQIADEIFHRGDDEDGEGELEEGETVDPPLRRHGERLDEEEEEEGEEESGTFDDNVTHLISEILFEKLSSIYANINILQER